MPLTSGTRLGPYEIVASAGTGGMGEVYRARDTRLERMVAIKVLPPHFADSSDRRQRFEREARAVSSLSHPHICTLHDIGQQEGLVYLVMEYLEGETLAERLEKGPLPTDQLLRYAVEIADALDKAHRQGVIHRDLKPGNIMLTKNGAKLMDFGLAKPAAGSATGTALEAMTQSKPLTAQGTIVGTFQYMAPEQLEGKEADARSDLFSFGALLYEMATGRRAFTGKTQASVIASILASNPPPITSLQPMTPPALERVVETCLAKDPDERFQAAHDLKLQLEWILEGGSAVGIPAPVAARRKRREGVAWTAALALALLALVLSALYWRAATREVHAVHAFIPPPENASYIFQGPGGGPAAISPDGRRLAFAAGSGGKQMLWIRPLESLTAQPLAGTEGAAQPFWSPDSRYVGFFADGKLKKIEASGGPPQALCAAPAARGGSWSREGVIVFAANASEGLSRVSAAGGAPTPVTKLDHSLAQGSHRWPFFLPGGRHFLYFAGGSAARVGENAGTYIGALDEDRSLPKGPILHGDSAAIYAQPGLPGWPGFDWLGSGPGYLLFVRDTSLMAQPFDLRRLRLTGEALPVAEHVQVNRGILRAVFSASHSGVLAYQMGGASGGWQLAWLDRNGKSGSTVGEKAISFAPRLSPDGKQLAAMIVDTASGNQDIWVFDLARGTQTRLTFDPAFDTYPVWSPDGSKIAFASNRKGPFNLYQKAANGVGSEELLLESPSDDRPLSWSRDGRYLAYARLDPAGKTKLDIWILPLFGDRKPFPFLESEFNEASGEFSPDGHWLAYASDETGKYEVYVVPFPGGSGKWQISTGGGSQPKWRGDGRELFYLAPDNRVMAVDIAAGGSTFHAGIPHPLFQASPAVTGIIGRVYDGSADGKRFIFASGGAASSQPLTLVVNWAAELKR